MDREYINELKRRRKKLVDEARQILDQAEKEDRDLTGEEQEKYDRLMREVDTLGQRIERAERQLEAEGKLDRGLPAPVAPAQPDEEPADVEDRAARPLASREYRDAFWSYIRRSLSGMLPHEVRALNIGTDADGGYLVPDEFQRELVQALAEQNVMRQIARTIQTGSGDRLIPVVVDHGQAQWIGESASYPESDAEFARVTLGAHKLARITRVTEELLNDSAFDIAAFLTQAFTRTFGDAEEAAFVNGDGNGKPRGVLLDAQVGVTAAATTAITADELIDLFHSLRPPYRARANWLIHDSTAAAIRKLKDNDGQYIWQPGLQAGVPDMLLGRPVRYSPFMPVLAAGAKPIAFGDFSYYWIADRQSIGIQRLVELYAAQGQVGFRMFERVDGRLVLPEAVKVLQMES